MVDAVEVGLLALGAVPHCCRQGVKSTYVMPLDNLLQPDDGSSLGKDEQYHLIATPDGASTHVLLSGPTAESSAVPIFYKTIRRAPFEASTIISRQARNSTWQRPSWTVARSTPVRYVAAQHNPFYLAASHLFSPIHIAAGLVRMVSCLPRQFAVQAPSKLHFLLNRKPAAVWQSACRSSSTTSFLDLLATSQHGIRR